MPLTILSDADVNEVLDSLTKQDILDIHKALADALHSYSTATNAEDSGCCSSNQPLRTTIKNKDGDAILFMPAMSDTGMGVKIVTVAESSVRQPFTESDRPSAVDSPINSRRTSIKSPLSTPHSSSVSIAESHTSSNTSSSSKRNSIASDPRRQSVLAASSPVTPTPSSSTSPRGSITLLTPSGHPRALINASTLTAFRTALTSTLIFKARASVHTLTVFGAGLQAYWHIYVSMLLRGDEIHHIHLINRDFSRAQNLVIQLIRTNNATVSSVMLSSKMKPSILTPEYVEYTRLLKENVRAADVIYCCTPSTEPLFPATHLTSTKGRLKARYIAAIGSYKPHMQELHEDIIHQAVRGPNADTQQHSIGGVFHVHQRHASEGGAIIVDTIEGATKEAGEVIRAGILGHSMVELGEIVMLKRGHRASKEREGQQRATDTPPPPTASSSSPTTDNSPSQSHHSGSLSKLLHHIPMHHREVNNNGSNLSTSGGGSGSGREPLRSKSISSARAKSRDRERAKSREREGDGGLMNWLEKGNVIYKSVGMGLMDVVVGMEVVRLAEERGIGTFVRDF